MFRISDVLAGAVSGMAGGVMMMAGQTLGTVQSPPLERVERWTEARTGKEFARAPQQEMIVSQSGHLVLSSLLGMGYGMLSSALKTSAIPAGPLYGMALYVWGSARSRGNRSQCGPAGR